MMHDGEKSHCAIVAAKPTSEAGVPAAEPVEPRAGSERNAGGQSTHRTQSRVRVSRSTAYGKPQGTGRRRGSPYRLAYVQIAKNQRIRRGLDNGSTRWQLTHKFLAFTRNRDYLGAFQSETLAVF
jgi:hypothetical protein